MRPPRPGYPSDVSVVLVVLVLLLSFVLLTGLAVALAAGAARLTGRGPTGDVALLRRELTAHVRTARELAAPRLRRALDRR